MTRGLRLTPGAVRDIATTFGQYEDQRPGLGERFRSELNVSLALMMQFNEAGPMVHQGLRRILVHRFPYALYYRLTATDVIIWACLHLRRVSERRLAVITD